MDRRRNNQEPQPSMEMIVQLELTESQPIDTTTWIWDDGSHCTMMFPNDY
ncbi:hypothetical protein SAMN00017405_0959 [Desulfonispora thiosulfatigenes DSM 11270]|uniref:Uncharacterized protein n=1 Tax=Desulfonispora thiosulfatigenes DSM 11270 TaxID=656914 RepID=A0A1W1UNR0_DESTI|nr:hypothetical protein [Desulfonispora thiosulfatigenes]SMB82726.1 hypothetical protein SAMN00017405_0959 [Desulfonispora thiosulfatigenes DSM 11270]